MDPIYPIARQGCLIMAKLLITLDGAQVGEIDVNKERISIGRRADNDIQLDHIAVSGQHAVVVSILNDSFLEDLGSTNGTLVNGAAVRKHFLRNGDLVEIGRHRLRYIGDQVAPREASDFEKTMVLNRPLATAAVAPVAGVMSATFANPAPADSGRDVGGAIAALMESQLSLQSHFAISSGPVLAGGGATALAASTSNAASTAVGLLPTAIPAAAPSILPAPATVAVAAGPAIAAVPALPADPQHASLQVLNGTAAGRLLALGKPLTTIGRPGIQVAVVSRRGGGHFLAQVEGTTPVVLNGAAVPAHAVALNAHDVIEIAGVKLEFFFERAEV